MSYDRDSFLAGLAVGRTLWRPHRDYGYEPIPPFDLIAESTGIYNCYEGSMYEPTQYITALKGHWYSHIYAYVQKAGTDPAEYRIETSSNRHCTGIIDVFIPARYKKIYVDVSCSGRTDVEEVASEIYLRSEYGLSNYEPDGFAGNNLKRITLCNTTMTSAAINSQPGVTINSTVPYSLSNQTVVIDVSDINVDMWFGMYRVNCGTGFISITASLS